MLRKIALIILSLGFLTGQQIAFAADGVEKAWWKTHFSAEFDFDQAFFQLDRLVLTAEEQSQCGEDTQGVLSGLKNYAKLSAGRSPKKAGRFGKDLLRQVNLPGACQSARTKTYILGSFYISQVDLLTALEKPLAFDQSSNETLHRNVFLAALLIHQNRVVVLDSATRIALGSEWNQSQVFGAYDCLETTVYIDPGFMPFDTGAIMEHELDHLMRDKYFSLQDLSRLFKKDDQVDWETYLTLDETFSGLNAASLQRYATTVAAFSDTTSYNWLGKPSTRKMLLGQLNAQNDFTFRSPNGPAEALFQGGLISNPAFVMTGRLQSPEPFLNLFGNLFNFVHRGYFANRDLAPFSRATLLKPQDKRLLPLFDLSVDPMSILRANPLRDELGAKQIWLRDRIYSSLEDLENLIKTPSQSCLAFQQAAQTGTIPDYEGAKFLVPYREQTNSETINPEHETLPGEHGTRPGEHGTRPGEHGTRPSKWVRPCLSLQRDW